MGSFRKQRRRSHTGPEGPACQAKRSEPTHHERRRALLDAIHGSRFDDAHTEFKALPKRPVGGSWLGGGSNYARRRLTLDWRPTWIEWLLTHFWTEPTPGPFAVADRGRVILIGYDDDVLLANDLTRLQCELLTEVGFSVHERTTGGGPGGADGSRS